MSDQKDTVRRGYDKLSYPYRSDDTPETYGDYAEWVGILTERLPKGAPVLDVGCGCGLPATRLLARAFEVTGVDFSAVQIERATKLVPSATFICSDIMALDFPPESFAAVVTFYAIIHMPLDDHPTLFQRMATWLRPGGILLAIVGHEAWTGETDSYLDVPGGKMCWSHAGEDAYVQWIEEAGLAVEWTRFIPEGDSGHTLVLARREKGGEAR